jgi:hypothetical protein
MNKRLRVLFEEYSNIKRDIPDGTQFTDEDLLLLRPNIAGEGFDASFPSSLQ